MDIFVQVYEWGLALVYEKQLFIGTLLVTVPLVLLIEYLVPEKINQSLYSVGFVNDGMWLVMIKLFKVTGLLWYIGVLETLYADHLNFLTITALSDLSDGVRFFLGFLLADFLNWFHHVVRHKVPWFWYFHTIHHSQPQLNLLTDFRFHPADYVIAETIQILPLLIFDFGNYEIVGFLVVHMFWTRFYHANIKLSLGPLKYILVTPQSHRVHHSCAVQHRDKNFGVFFSIWDRVFGTQYSGCDEYPETGIGEPTFPVEHSCNPISIAETLWEQFVYPFKKIVEDVREPKRARLAA